MKFEQTTRYYVNSINVGGKNMYRVHQICSMTDFLVDDIFVKLENVGEFS